MISDYSKSFHRIGIVSPMNLYPTSSVIVQRRGTVMNRVGVSRRVTFVGSLPRIKIKIQGRKSMGDMGGVLERCSIAGGPLRDALPPPAQLLCSLFLGFHFFLNMP